MREFKRALRKGGAFFCELCWGLTLYPSVVFKSVCNPLEEGKRIYGQRFRVTDAKNLQLLP